MIIVKIKRILFFFCHQIFIIFNIHDLFESPNLLISKPLSLCFPKVSKFVKKFPKFFVANIVFFKFFRLVGDEFPLFLHNFANYEVSNFKLQLFQWCFFSYSFFSKKINSMEFQQNLVPRKETWEFSIFWQLDIAKRSCICSHSIFLNFVSRNEYVVI